MALANDNFWGYTSDLLYKYQVTWLEAAIVQPCWTSMLVCYVEGDEGHLFGEQIQQQQFRTTRHRAQLPHALGKHPDRADGTMLGDAS